MYHGKGPSACPHEEGNQKLPHESNNCSCPTALQPQHSHLTKPCDPLNAIPHSAQEEDVMSRVSHHQTLPSIWAPAADLSHFHSPKLSRDTRLHLPPLQPQSRAACLPPSSTGGFVVYHRRGRDPGNGEISGHTQRKDRVKAGPRGCFPSLRPSLCITHAAETFPASPWGWLTQGATLLGSENLPERWRGRPAVPTARA